MFKFIHTADIHLDSARVGVQRERATSAVEIQQAPRQALKNLVQLAIDEKVAFVLFAGDLYDGDWQDFHTGLFFLEQLKMLNEAGIRVFLVAGNHDAANVMTKTLPLPGEDKVKMFAAKAPETVVIDELGVAVHGQSFARRAVEEDLAQGYPAAVPGLFNIGLLHTSATIAGGEHDRYAPCSIETLLSKGYQYWALGHIHKRQDLRPSPDAPPLAFPGNLQGRHIRETGAKGCSLVAVDQTHNIEVEFRAVDVLRWQRCLVDVAGAQQADEVVQRVAQELAGLLDASEGLPVAARVELRGACVAHRSLVSEPNRWDAAIRAAAIEVAGDRLWIERVVRSTTLPRSGSDPSIDAGPLGELCEFVQEMKHDEEAVGKLVAEMASLRARLPAELTEGTDSLELDQPDRIRQLLDDAAQVLIQRIQGQGTGE